VNNALRALMVTSDPLLTTKFAEIAREVGIEAHSSEKNGGIPDELRSGKYEGVLLDFDGVVDAMSVLIAVRQSRSNENAVIFAVATYAPQRNIVLENGANLLLERPLDAKQIRRALYAGYDQMVRERRRYFRCAVQVPVLLTRPSSQADFRCTSINISSSGIALNTTSIFKQGEEVQIMVFLRKGAELAVRAIATVVWDDKHGKTGLSFKCCSPQHQTDLDSWLDSQLPFLLQSSPANHEISN
jgi:DNA-binding response OmpR family regulator